MSTEIPKLMNKNHMNHKMKHTTPYFKKHTTPTGGCRCEKPFKPIDLLNEENDGL